LEFTITIGRIAAKQASPPYITLIH